MNLRDREPFERVPIERNHLVDKDAAHNQGVKDLEHVGIEKVEQLFRDMRYATGPKIGVHFTASTRTLRDGHTPPKALEASPNP